MVACAERPAEDYRHDLLDLAFSAVAKMPEDPHFKNKARAQYELVGCALKLDRPGWASTYADRELYWQQGAAWADIALYYAQNGDRKAAGNALSTAEAWLRQHEPAFIADETEQSWRIARVKTKIIQAGIALGREDYDPGFLEGLEAEDAAVLIEQQARLIAEGDGQAAFVLLQNLAGTGDFEAVRIAIDGLVDLYDRHYSDESFRSTIKDTIIERSANTPFAFRIDTLVKLGQTALAHGDAAEALKDATTAGTILEDQPRAPRFRIPAAAGIATLRCRAGDRAAGLKELDELLLLFDEQQHLLLNIDQAGLLCSLAEAYHRVGETARALHLYERAIEAGQINPNSRPRLDDLCRICCSLAAHGIEPTESLWRQLEEMNNNLGMPW